MNVNAAIAQSLVYVGAKDEDTINSIMTSLMIFPKERMDKEESILFGVALALNFLGKQEDCETVLEALDGVEHPNASHFKIIVESAAYIGSGNVLKI